MNKYNIRRELEAEYFEKLNNLNNMDTPDKHLDKVPSHTTIYNILRLNTLNKLNNEMIGNSRENIRKIIREDVGELAHMDCHYLPKNIIRNDFKDRYYLVGLIDDKSRIISLELSKDIQSITVMFKTLEMINFLRNIYNIEFKEMLTDNGSEFGGGKEKKNKYTNPFERLLKELNIKHRYTKPYHPQTNGKIERLWKTINSELLDNMVFDSEKHFREELMKYTIYFNEYRPHSSLDGKTPKEIADREREEKTRRGKGKEVEEAEEGKEVEEGEKMVKKAKEVKEGVKKKKTKENNENKEKQR
jgi:transposase InsO family protein